MNILGTVIDKIVLVIWFLAPLLIALGIGIWIINCGEERKVESRVPKPIFHLGRIIYLVAILYVAMLCFSGAIFLSIFNITNQNILNRILSFAVLSFFGYFEVRKVKKIIKL